MLVFLSRQFQMKTMQETMKQRSEKYAGDHQDNQAGIKRVERGEKSYQPPFVPGQQVPCHPRSSLHSKERLSKSNPLGHGSQRYRLPKKPDDSDGHAAVASQSTEECGAWQ
jgi:hypothetical protein